jgi:outer membrane murein-binding lipoprotein Lpp
MRTLLVTAVCGASLMGCSSARVMMPTDNDVLRREVRALREQVSTLEAQRAELQQQLEAATKPIAAAGTVDAEVAEATPQLVSLTLEAGSHFASKGTASEPTVCEAVMYVKPTDGLGRFMQIVGRARASAFQLHADGRVVNLGSAQWNPIEVRDAWRDGMFGAHYTLRLPLAAEGWSCGGGPVTVRVEFISQPDGRTYYAQRELPFQK